VDYDLVTQWTLWFFGACFGGIALGFLVGKLAGFEAGLGVGLLLAGCVSLSFVPRFWIEHDDLSHHPLRRIGTVVAVEDRAVNAAGDVTTPVAIVEYETSSGEKRRAPSKAASGLDVGEVVTVVPQPVGDAKIGQASQMQGGAIAALLFGTFPFSAGLYFLASALVGRREEKLDRKAQQRAAERQQRRSRITPIANLVMFAGFAGPILWATTQSDPPVLRTVLQAFALGAAGIWIHVADGFRMRRDLRWTLGMAVVALNFSVWAAALWSLGDSSASW
jgi:hypothetical protein